MMHDTNCPYCNAIIEIDNYDGQGYEEDVLHEENCWNCGKNFTFYTRITFSYEAFKADCLNDGEHVFKPTTTYPKEFTRMKCVSCEKERKPTKEELQEILKEK